MPAHEDAANVLMREIVKHNSAIFRRAAGEEMESYIHRRERAWNTLADLSPEYAIPSKERKKLLLNNARLNEHGIEAAITKTADSMQVTKDRISEEELSDTLL